ncbi:MAG: hypothetical protein CME06_07240 [Gemmatimonadetes bacterium]|nr:hypothetical protein [Gemmatimonadota bacterium]
MLALLMLWAGIGGSLHYSVVPHTRCADHGEIVHGEEAAPHAPRIAGLGILPDEPRESDHEHEHCVFTQAERARIARALAEQRAAHPSALAPCADTHTRQFNTLALFRLAPKHSPPV